MAKEKVEAKCDASYITIDYLKTPSVNIDASKAAVLLNKIGSDIDTANKEYQDYKTTVNAKIVNLGSTSKTQITDSSINTLDLSQEEGKLGKNVDRKLYSLFHSDVTLQCEKKKKV